MRARASLAHWWGLRQPSHQSWAQVWHAHVGVGRWGWSILGVRILSDMAIRSATVVTVCRRRRHLAGMVAMECGFASGWYQVGSWARSCGDRCIAARWVWYFLATRSILIIPSFRSLSLAPQFGAFHDCRNVFSHARCEMPGGAAWLMIKSVIVAHMGREGVKFRYNFSQTISMASFLEWMFNRLRPPSLGGRHRKSRAILGDESFSHINFLVILVRAVLIEGGIPCALARN
jgi:hypothetical protein